MQTRVIKRFCEECGAELKHNARLKRWDCTGDPSECDIISIKYDNSYPRLNARFNPKKIIRESRARTGMNLI